MKAAVLTLFIVPFILSLGAERPLEIDKKRNKVVLELFTSQGCSSCPPADELLKDLRSEDVIALSYHVDYWNYIGWKDPFSNPQFTQRQRNYAAKFNSSTIYTPMLVINGKEQLVGSRSEQIKNAMNGYRYEENQANLEISQIQSNNEYISFEYKGDADITNAKLRVLLIIDERITEVKRGENRNRSLINNNIVVAEQEFKVETLSGKGRILIPEVVNPSDHLSLVLILENHNLDVITAAQRSL